MSHPGPPNLNLGYWFYPPDDEGAPGHPRLDVVLRAIPTGRHFDPVEARCTVAHPTGGVCRLEVSHPWHGEDSLRACAGRVIVTDPLGEVVEAFSYGGDLVLEAGDDFTLCSLVSPAPILDLLVGHSAPTLLAEESEVLIARRRAAWLSHPHTFEEHLARADPLVLYCACLTALVEHFDRARAAQEVEAYQRFHHFLHAEVRRIHEQMTWPAHVPPLDELL